MNDHRPLSILMRVIAVALGVGFGATHLLFPARYFALLGQTGYDAADPFHLFLAQCVGVVIVALCVGIWMAASDPAKYRLALVQFLVAGVLTVLVFLFHLLVTGAIGGLEWLSVLAVAVLVAVVWRLYPRVDEP
ncbi:MAG: hypothetical protein H6684_15815 [Deltaproteobacteria bacterium]|nr:hypothetical protein [Deltaproteobacteria bacterium]MCB9490197.1 hypothetical protein [Deltaproteobacteria bacterium]